MSPRSLTRRDFLASGLVALGASVGGWRGALAAPAIVGDGPYGPLRSPDANGIRLPDGFTSRVIAISTQAVAGHRWHTFPDGGATFATADGGWIYVSNSEVANTGGVGAVRLNAEAAIVDAYPILSGTSLNCAGGPTPWGTWLSCEEHSAGRVWECDPTGDRQAVVREAMGVFTHEAAAVDPVRRHVYLTEDHRSGRFYRFVPEAYPDLSSGTLYAARVADLGEVERGGSSRVDWVRVPDPLGRTRPTRQQVFGTTIFRGGEGTWYADGLVAFTTKHDDRVWLYDADASTISLLYDRRLSGAGVLAGVDNITGTPDGGWVVAEDGGDLELVLVADGAVSRLLQVTGRDHAGSELAGPAFDPSGTRLYFSSQRGFGTGVTFEVTGPFAATASPSPRSSATPLRTPTATPADDPGPTGLVAGAVIAGVAAVAGAARYIRTRARRG